MMRRRRSVREITASAEWPRSRSEGGAARADEGGDRIKQRRVEDDHLVKAWSSRS